MDRAEGRALRVEVAYSPCGRTVDLSEVVLAEGSTAPRACRVELNLRYAFSSLALEAVVSPVFDRIANTLVDSFVKRAEQVHGPR